jgi:hypothetical protein
MPAVLKSVHASRVKERACQTFYMLVCVFDCVCQKHMSLMMIALGCLSRTQLQSNRMKNSMPAVLKSVHASRVKERACQPC